MLDPYKVLNIDQNNLTFDILKQKYKKLVLKYHPDLGGSESLFKTITFCYKYLLNELKAREEQKEHSQLKSQSEQTQKEFAGKQSVLFQGKDFNIEKFNTTFENYKFQNNYIDDGYSDWIKEEKLEDNGAIINYQDPEPLFMGSKTLGNLYEIGKTKVTDYSSDNISNRSLNFMDLKVAYTTSKIVDEKKVDQRPEFKSVEQLKNHRANISHVMSKEDLAKHVAKEIALKNAEDARLENIKKEDSEIEKFFKKTNQVMLSLFGTGK